MSFCPKWIYEIACAHAAIQFLSSALDSNTVSQANAQTLGKYYSEIPHQELVSFVDKTVRFLDEIKAGDSAVELLHGFCHNRVHYEGPRKPRKMKSLLASADDPVKVKNYSAEEAATSFRAYVFALRNEVTELAPAGWGLAQVEDSDVIAALAKQVINPIDYL